MATPEEILEFWFGSAPAETPEALLEKIGRWYQGGPEETERIRERFADDVERALAGEYDHWADGPDSRLALLLLLDQFTRSIYAGTPRAFAGDPKAQKLALETALWDLPHEKRHFFVMPFLHAEDLALQEKGVELMREHVERAPDVLRPIYAMGNQQSVKYREVIARFGRFPHRNAALGRETTPDEQEFLESWQQPPTPPDLSGRSRR